MRIRVCLSYPFHPLIVRSWKNLLRLKKIEFKKLGKVVSKEKGIDIGTHKFDLEELNNIYFNSIPNILEDNRC